MEKSVIAGRYALSGPQSLLGQGGMGAVYLSTDTRTGQMVAVKHLKKEVLLHDPEIVGRFRREGEVLRQLNHPSIVKMIDAVEEGGDHYLVMEYVDGGSLRDLLDEQSPLSLQRALYIALDLADALTRAHRLNILHRDIKPGNVLLAADGTPRLTDFGVARVGGVHVTQSGAIVGTLAYISPEALDGKPIDERSDIWAFGVMLYEMLTGQRPFPQDHPGALIQAIMTHPLPDLEAARPDLPTALVDLIYRMLDKNPLARIRSVRLVGAELEAVIQGNTASIQHVPASDDSGRFATPTPGLVELDTARFVAPNNLPAQATPFVGRSSELETLTALLANPDARLITLVGAGGMGKTRLALAAAERRLGHFRDGVYFVPLDSVEQPERIISTLGDQLNFTFPGGQDETSALFSYLHEKHMLLLFDNFEHLTAGAGLLADILQAAPQLCLMVTTRERLRLRGEHVQEVHGMLPPQRPTVQAMEGNPATQLFLQVARRVQPDFALDEETAPHIARIITHVGGLPLGIELAAGWLEVMPVDEVAGEIERSLDFLETDLRDVPARHRSLRTVFQYSWDLMSEEERDTLLRLSVFRGGFEREAAQKVAGASLRTLTALVNKSLLLRDPDGRYAMHKILRQFIDELFAGLPAAESKNIHAAHAMYYAALLERLGPLMNSKKEQAAIDQIETELENLRAAWDWAISERYWESIDKVLQTITLFYTGRGLMREGGSMMHELAETLAAAGQGDSRLYWRARTREAWLMGRLGDYAYALEQARRAYDYFRESDPQEAAYALNASCYAYMMQGDYPASVHDAQAAIEALQGVQHDGNVLYTSMANLGYALYLQGDYPEARQVYEELLVLEEKHEASLIGQAYAKNNLGEILRELGEVDRALQLFADAYSIFERYKHRLGMAFTLNNTGGLQGMLGHRSDARQALEQVYEIYRELGDRFGLGHALSALGNMAVYIDSDFPQAESYYRQALEVRQQIGHLRGVADSCNDLAQVAMMQGNTAEAQKHLQKALGIYREIGDPVGTGFALVALAQAALQAPETPAYLEEARALARETGNQFLLVQSSSVWGDLCLETGRLDEAAAAYYGALGPSYENRLPSVMLYVLVGLADLAYKQGDREQGLALVAQIMQYQELLILNSMERAQTRLEQLRQELPAETITTSFIHARSRTLEEFVAELLAQRPQ